LCHRELVLHDIGVRFIDREYILRLRKNTPGCGSRWEASAENLGIVLVRDLSIPVEHFD